MTRSKLSAKAVLLAGGIGLSMAAFAGSQPAAAQSYADQYTCPAGYVYDPTYGCTVSDEAYAPYDYGDYGYLPYGGYGSYYGGHREFGHGFGHGMGNGVGFAHAGGGFAHGMGGGFGHGMGGGFGHGGGGGHR
jgi:hypothetical protein